MSSSFLEIHELSSGEIVLKRSDDTGGEALVTIKFSAESTSFLGNARFEVAKAMIEAGMDAASEMAEHTSDDLSSDYAEQESVILH